MFSPIRVLAHHQGLVLGETTDPTQLDLPVITQGAGLFLPDSPFYFLDEAFQNLKLKLTLDPEKRARLGLQIAGERLAELKIMLSRNNPAGIDTALSQLKKADDLTSRNLNETKALGKDVSHLSQEINEAVKLHQQALEKLENQANGSLQLKFKATKEGLKETKNKIEDQLPEELLDQEIEHGLEQEIEDKVHDASESAKHLENQLKELEKESSKSARKALKNREEALKKALKQNSETLKKEEEGKLKNEKRKQEMLLETQKRMMEEAQKAVFQNQEASQGFQNLNQKIREIRNENREESKSGGDHGGKSGKN